MKANPKFKRGVRVVVVETFPHYAEFQGRAGVIDTYDTDPTPHYPFVIFNADGQRRCIAEYHLELETEAAPQLTKNKATTASVPQGVELPPNNAELTHTEETMTAAARDFVTRNFEGNAEYFHQLGVFSEFIKDLYAND